MGGFQRTKTIRTNAMIHRKNSIITREVETIPEAPEISRINLEKVRKQAT